MPGFGASSGGRSGDSWFDLEIGDLWVKQRDGWHKIFIMGARGYIGSGPPTEDRTTPTTISTLAGGWVSGQHRQKPD